MSLVNSIGDRIDSFHLDQLPRNTLEYLKLLLLVNFSVAVAGSPYTLVPHQDRPSDGRYVTINTGKSNRIEESVFFNAAIMHARTQDDFHSVVNAHVGTIVIPATLALAQEHDLNGIEFLEAIAAGYITMIAVGHSFSKHTTPRGFRSSGIYGPFGSAAAAAKIFKFNAQEIAHAIGFAASLASGTGQCWVDGSDEWQLHVAEAATNGIKAARWAQLGLKAAHQALEGPSGFYKSFSGLSVEPNDVLPYWDSSVINDVSFKRYPASGIGQSVIYLSEKLVDRKWDNSVAEIEHVDIWMNPFEYRYPGSANRGPFTSASDALMSVALCSSIVFINGKFDLNQLYKFNHGDYIRMMDRIQIHEDPTQPYLSARMEVKFSNGSSLYDEVRDGHDEISVTWDNVDEWASALWSEGGRSRDDYMKFKKIVQSIEDQSSVEELSELLTGN